MKRIAAFIAAILLLSSHALADINLSSMTLEELIALKQQIGLEIASRPEVKSVTVPIGVWVVGKDIPAGHWNISTAKGYGYDWSRVTYCSNVDETGKNPVRTSKGTYYSSQVTYPGSANNNAPTMIDLDIRSGLYIIVEWAPVTFTPFTGKPDLGFDW